MENKTCGECRFFESKEFICCSSGDEVAAHFNACYNFEPMPEQRPTTGDKIRQMSNTDLAEMLVYPVKPMNVNGTTHYEFTSCLLLGKSYPMREQAVFLTERRLNAPAEREAENV